MDSKSTFLFKLFLSYRLTFAKLVPTLVQASQELLPSSAQAPAKPSWAEVSLIIISLDGRPTNRLRNEPGRVYSEQAKGPSELKFCMEPLQTQLTTTNTNLSHRASPKLVSQNCHD